MVATSPVVRGKATMLKRRLDPVSDTRSAVLFGMSIVMSSKVSEGIQRLGTSVRSESVVRSKKLVRCATLSNDI